MINLGIEIHKNVDITMLIKSRSKYGPESIELIHFVLAAQGEQFLYVVID